MLAVIFLPQLSPATALPGTKGTLMAALGIVAAVAAVITALQWLAYLGLLGSLNTIISSWPWSARSSRHGRDGRSLAIRSSALSTATAFVGWGSSRGPRSAGGPAAATLGTS